MGKKKSLSTQRLKLSLLTNISYSQRDTAKRCDVSRVSIRNIKKKLAYLESLTPKRCGKKKPHK